MNRADTPTVAELMALLAANAAEIAALKAEREALAQRVVKLEEELALARLHRFAPRSEKHMDRVFNEAEKSAVEGDDEGCDGTDCVDLPNTGLPEAEKAEGKKPGRRRLPENLPRERVEYDLADDQKNCPCCGDRMHRMGELVTEQLHIEVKAKVLQNARFKYACRHCDRTGISTPIVIAPMPAQPLPGSVATASTLAFALVHKYVDGTPLYRLAKAFERAGVPVSRGALGHWVIGSSERHLIRVYDALMRLRSQTVIHGDETTVQVLKEKDKAPTSTSYMWAYRSGEDSEQPIVLFDYQPGRGQEYPQTFLADYRGILMSDGYSAWRTLKGATHVGCMAHARRRFVEALKARKKPGGPPAQALKFFDQLYRIERQARDEKPDDGDETQADYLRRFRHKHSVPVLSALKAWLNAIAPKVVPDTKLGDAVSYTLNQWEYLTRYTEDGRMPIDNNLLERDIRIFATGRKSWLFSDTVDGAKASAVIYSLMLTCRACRVEPFAWLRHVLTELPQRPDNADIEDLLPHNFKKQPA